jgi:hypothetical protein
LLQTAVSILEEDATIVARACFHPGRPSGDHAKTIRIQPSWLSLGLKVLMQAAPLQPLALLSLWLFAQST